MKTSVTAQQIQDWCEANNATVFFAPGFKVKAGHADDLGSSYSVAELESKIGLPFLAEGFAVTLDVDGYYSLANVLGRAFDQASGGKGKERHATSLPFDQQPMQTLAGMYGPGFLLGQAAKKSQESQRLPEGRDVAELLGAINYLAGAVIFLENTRRQVANDNQQLAAAKHG
jgi:hypothetical protein